MSRFIIGIFVATAAITSASGQTPPDNNAMVSPTASAAVERPETPSLKTKIPFPPAEGGCYHLVRDKWQKVPCATQEQMKKRPPLAISVPSITATAPQGGATVTPITWGSVAVAITSDPTQAKEMDSTYGANAFSIQANTNFFPCSTCKTNYPLPGSRFGDTAWVQFGDQVTGSRDASDMLCISEWDRNLGNTGAAYNATSKCVNPTNVTGTVLTGPHAFIGGAEVIGYYHCPPGSDTATAKCLHLMAYLPWAGGWWYVDAPDWYGLGTQGNWSNVNGTIYGYGSGSTANFTKAEVVTVVRAYSCFLGPSASQYFAVPCTTGSFISNLNDEVSYTKEGNNLKITKGPAGSCQGTECAIYYTSAAP